MHNTAIQQYSISSISSIYTQATIDPQTQRHDSIIREGKYTRGGVYFVLYVFVLYFVLYFNSLAPATRPPVIVAAAASAMAPRVWAGQLALALGYAQCLTLSSIM
jgi:hypothetical protein